MSIILVTGANKGIGYQITKKLLENNYNVLAVSKNTDNLKKLKMDNLILFKCNLIDNEDIKKLFKFIKESKIVVDTLINNAGIGLFGKIDELSIDDWDNIIKLNLTVPFILTNELVKKMKALNYGRIINICSDASYQVFDEASAYCATKHGLYGFSKALSLELKRYGISVTAICPGRVDTYFNNKEPGCRPKSLQPSDISNIILDVIKYDLRCNVESIMVSSIYE